MVEGISHITLIVKDLERSSRIFVDVLGGEEVYSSGTSSHLEVSNAPHCLS
jgi:catechol 2,3-dioxygenase-like lactoylglutathione lyase family enzyme